MCYPLGMPRIPKYTKKESDSASDKDSPVPQGPVGLAPAGHRESESDRTMPSPKTALLWVECYVCHKKVPLCRIKAHQRISHPPFDSDRSYIPPSAVERSEHAHVTLPDEQIKFPFLSPNEQNEENQ